MSEYYADLVQRIGTIGGKKGDEAKQRVERLDCANPDKTLESCDGKKRSPPLVRERQETLKKANADDAAYRKALAATLTKIACTSSDDQIYILRGLAENDRLAAAGSEAIALVDFILSKDCSLSASVTEEDNVMLLKIRGTAYSNKRDFEHAVADSSKVIDLDPTAEAYKTRGKTYVTNRDFEHAIADFAQAIALAPDDADAYIYRGIAYSNNRDFEHAIADLSKVIDLDPTAVGYQARGRVYARTRNYDGSRRLQRSDQARSQICFYFG